MQLALGDGMKNELNRIPIEDSFETQRSTNKTIGIIVSIVFCAVVFLLGIKNHWPIVITIWLLVIFVLSEMITFKLKSDGSAIYSRLIMVGTFVILFIISSLLNMVIRLIGLDILQWTF